MKLEYAATAPARPEVAGGPVARPTGPPGASRLDEQLAREALGVVEVPAAREEAAEVLAAFWVQRDYLAVENRIFDPQLLPHPVTKLLELLEKVAAL